MPYAPGSRLPGETASKLGHIAVIESEWVRSLLEDFNSVKLKEAEIDESMWKRFDPSGIQPLSKIWSVDGSFVPVKGEGNNGKEVSFVKTALLLVDKLKIDKIDKENPHPILLQDILKDSAVFHSTVLPLKNVTTSLGNNYDAVRHIIKDSIKIDEGGIFYETLKWLVYKKWSGGLENSPGFECPHCHHNIEAGLQFDSNEGACPSCQKIVFLSDMIGFHLDMDEESAPDSIASAYMLVMEHLMIFTPIRLLWDYSDKRQVSETLFIKDGPLTLRSQYSKLVPSIRAFLQHSKDVGRPIHIIGQEKSGAFFDHLASIVKWIPPQVRGEQLNYAALTHDYVRQQVYRSPDLSNPYGKRTNWGEKLLVKVDPATYMVLNVPTGSYLDNPYLPLGVNLIGLDRILATLKDITSHKFEGALFPVELANGIASMSSYLSARILQRFLEG